MCYELSELIEMGLVKEPHRFENGYIRYQIGNLYVVPAHTAGVYLVRRKYISDSHSASLRLSECEILEFDAVIGRISQILVDALRG